MGISCKSCQRQKWKKRSCGRVEMASMPRSLDSKSGTLTSVSRKSSSDAEPCAMDFHVPCWPCVCHFRKNFHWVFCPFCNWIVCFLMLNCRECLCILTIKPLLVISFASTFSHSVGCLFILLMVPFIHFCFYFFCLKRLKNIAMMIYCLTLVKMASIKKTPPQVTNVAKNVEECRWKCNFVYNLCGKEYGDSSKTKSRTNI